MWKENNRRAGMDFMGALNAWGQTRLELVYALGSVHEIKIK